MKWLRRLWNYVVDSPTYGLDRGALFSGTTVGVSSILLNGAVLLALVPLMLMPRNNYGSNSFVITDYIEFGQLMTLVLLGGATAIATILIPLRMTSVFWGPRIGRYFDQIVLSGITPFRFLVGKVISQNLLLGLFGFLLLPYLVLTLTLGGVDLTTLLAGAFLVWLYCMMLALWTLWATVHVNDLIAALSVMSASGVILVLSFLPVTPQPFLLSPVPTLMAFVYHAVPDLSPFATTTPSVMFVRSTLAMLCVCGVSLIGITIGPLYGIIRDNSTFGEVVRPGDTRKKRWLRLRPHIQRPSEITFFYENRADIFRKFEGLLRWGSGLLLVIGALAVARYLFYTAVTTVVTGPAPMRTRWFADAFHSGNLVIHGATLFLTITLFSHPRNTVLMPVTVWKHWKMRVCRLDTLSFVTVLIASTVSAIAMPLWFESHFAAPNELTIFPLVTEDVNPTRIDFTATLVKGVAVICVASVVWYSLHRLICLTSWLRLSAMLASSLLYVVFFGLLPMILIPLHQEYPELHRVLAFGSWAPTAVSMSPMGAIGILYNSMPSGFPPGDVTAFFAGHAVLFALFLFLIRRGTQALRADYPEATFEKRN